ncbi:MAG: M23 family metallopeptidase [Coriobacteriia bacterium]|nr:M23 family metallopeptidase [Coriobacteriia bacterium]
MVRSYARAVALVGLMAAVLGGQQVSVAFGVQVLLGFGESYGSEDGSALHRGVDVAASAGDPVVSPVAGEVSFAGRVPGQAGGSVLVVSVRCGDDVISLSPLERIDVEKGQRVAQGDSIGRLASTGDPSSLQTHLHVSLRRQGVYLDPGSLLAGVAPPTERPAVPAESVSQPGVISGFVPAVEPIVDVPVAQAESGPAPTTAPAAPSLSPEVGRVTEPGVSPVRGSDDVSVMVPEGVTVPLPAYVADAAAISPAVVAVGGYGSGLGVRSSGGSSLLARLGTSVRETTAIVRDSLVSSADGRPSGRGLRSALTQGVRPAKGSHGSESTPVPSTPTTRTLSAAVTWGGLGLLVATLLGVTYLLSRSAFERHILFSQPVSDRFGSMLQHLRAGDTLCGLTSCSGLLPSQSRGRLAQRR